MVRVLGVVCAVLALGCARKTNQEAAGSDSEPPPTEAASLNAAGAARGIKSFGGGAVLEQLRTATGCTARCILKSRELWTSPHCFGAEGDFVFVSDDCEAVISVTAAPPAETRWADTVVLTRYARDSTEREYKGGPMLADSAVQRKSGRYQWLKSDPHHMRGGVGVEFNVLSGTTTRLPFRESTVLGEERYENAGSAPSPAAAQGQAARRYEPRYPDPAYAAPTHAAPAAPPPAPAPEPARTIRVWTNRGAADIPVQAAPTIKPDPGGAMSCRTEGQGCGTNADCCGGTCAGGQCR